jgi:hypothetical protein
MAKQVVVQRALADAQAKAREKRVFDFLRHEFPIHVVSPLATFAPTVAAALRS